MYGDQFGEFVCGYWDLKGYSFKKNEHSAPQSRQVLQTFVHIW